MYLECIESLTPTAQSITVALSVNKSLFPPLHITTKQFYVCGCQQDNLRDCQYKEHFALLSTFLWLVEQKKYVFKQSLTTSSMIRLTIFACCQYFYLEKVSSEQSII